MTKEERQQIAIEEMAEHPTETLGQVALVKIAEIGISADAENTIIKTWATINGVRYELKGVITWQPV